MAWSPPAADQWNGPLQGFRVFYERLGSLEGLGNTVFIFFFFVNNFNKYKVVKPNKTQKKTLKTQ